MKYIIALVLFLLISLNTNLLALDQITLQLKWTHAFQFAGYYAALEKGYYQEAGLDVKILEASPEVDVVEIVGAGKAQYGVGSSGLLLERAEGIPVVVLAVIFQHSPYEIYAAPEIMRLSDIQGKKLMLEPHSEELTAYLLKSDINLNDIQLIPHSFDPYSLINGETMAMSGYISSEPYYFKQARYPYQAFNPRSVGIDFYGDNLFTTEQEVSENPKRVKAFLEASLKGWQYAKENADEIIDLIYNKYSQLHTKDYLHYESDQMIPLLQPDLIEIGYMNPNRWRHIADTYAEIGLLPENYSLKGFIYEEKDSNIILMYKGFALTVFIIIIISLIAIYIFKVNRKLSSSLKSIKQINTALSESERSYYGLFNSISEAIYIQDANGKFIDVNLGVEQMYGYSRDEIIGNGPDFLAAPGKNELPRVLEHVEKAFATGKPQIFEFWGKRKNGEIFPKEVILNRSKYFGQDVIVATARDISENKQAQGIILNGRERLKNLNRIIRHDLSNDLIVIRSGLKLYKRDADKGMLEEIENRVNKSIKTIYEYKDYEDFIDSNAKLKEADISPFLNDLIKDFPELKFIIEGDCMVFTDDTLRSVFINLINNSLKHGKATEIKIRVLSEKDACKIEFLDNGTGIPDEIRDKIFEEGFYYGESGNTGMGLSIVKQTLKSYGGSISLAEDQKNGTCFIIELKKVYV